MIQNHLTKTGHNKTVSVFSINTTIKVASVEFKLKMVSPIQSKLYPLGETFVSRVFVRGEVIVI